MKAKIRKTGEIVEIICYNCDTSRSNIDSVTYIDSKGNEHDHEQGLNFYWDFEPLDIDANINWEQRRYEIAKAAMQGMLSNQWDDVMNSPEEYQYVANNAIKYADTFIVELKKK